MANKRSDYILQKPLFLTLIRELEGELYQKHLKLLGKTMDFGCGDGFFATQFFPRQINIGVDVDKEIEAKARRSNAYKKVIVFNGHNLPFSSNSFDTLVSNCVLEHISNLDGNLKEISRVLKPGGKFYTTVMESHWNNFLFGRLLFGNLYSNWMRRKQLHHNLLTEWQWKEKFNTVGLQTTYSKVYLNRRLSRLIDIFHYLGVGNLLTYKLFGRWVLFPSLRRFFPIGRLLAWGKKDSFHPGGAIFFICQKS